MRSRVPSAMRERAAVLWGKEVPVEEFLRAVSMAEVKRAGATRKPVKMAGAKDLLKPRT